MGASSLANLSIYGSVGPNRSFGWLIISDSGLPNILLPSYCETTTIQLLHSELEALVSTVSMPKKKEGLDADDGPVEFITSSAESIVRR